mmetsp:Transcript_30876/g.82826  ORF Transcript_30876/g.82826 Transcript_30876/m.82826 type:complete len:242 (+) Transcript_30876:83-808(+)
MDEARHSSEQSQQRSHRGAWPGAPRPWPAPRRGAFRPLGQGGAEAARCPAVLRDVAVAAPLPGRKAPARVRAEVVLAAGLPVRRAHLAAPGAGLHELLVAAAEGLRELLAVVALPGLLQPVVHAVVVFAGGGRGGGRPRGGCLGRPARLRHDHQTLGLVLRLLRRGRTGATGLRAVGGEVGIAAAGRPLVAGEAPAVLQPPLDDAGRVTALPARRSPVAPTAAAAAAAPGLPVVVAAGGLE